MIFIMFLVVSRSQSQERHRHVTVRAPPTPVTTKPIGLFVCQSAPVSKVQFSPLWQVWCRRQDDNDDCRYPTVGSLSKDSFKLWKAARRWADYPHNVTEDYRGRDLTETGECSLAFR